MSLVPFPKLRLGRKQLQVAQLLVAAAALAAVVGTFHSLPQSESVLKQQWGLNQLYYHEAAEKLRAVAAASGSTAGVRSIQTLLEPPRVDTPSGFFAGAVTVAIHGSTPDSRTHYTLDGGVPTRRSPRYREPVTIDETRVLRCRAFTGNVGSDTVTRTYFVDEKTTLPVVSVVSDPVKIFNYKAGIYGRPLQRGKRWERTAVLEYFLPAEDYNEVSERRSLSLPVALRIHGGWTRRKSKKSLRFSYDPVALEGATLPGWIELARGATRRTKVLRNGGNRPRVGLRDKLFQTWYSDVAEFVSRPHPCVLFINGAYWGIYDLRDKIGQESVSRDHGEGEYDVVRGSTRDPSILAGDASHWSRTLDFFESHDLANEKNYAEAGELIDLDDWTDYVLFNIYAAHQDWPAENVTLFRRRDGGDGRWRTIPWDADTSFAADHPHALPYGEGAANDTLGWALRTEWVANRDPMETLLLRKLLASAAYRHTFLLRFCDLLNSSFRPARIEELLDQLVAEVRAELPRDWSRWSTRVAEYWEDVESIRQFARERPARVEQHFRERFGLGPLRPLLLRVDGDGQGKLQVGGLHVSRFPWTGSYFQDLTVEVTAEAAPGSVLVGWSKPGLGSSTVVRVNTLDVSELVATFEKR